MVAQDKFILTKKEPEPQANSEELAKIIVERIGLMPRKKGSTDNIFRTLIEFYERQKQATAKKNAKLAVMTVEEMAMFAGVSRQTMYEYLQRWLMLNIIQKVSYIGEDNKVVIGYKLSASTLEDAFSKAKKEIVKNVDQTISYVSELQKRLKNEKISQAQKKINVYD